jgi:two-component system, sensor histidine kinase and response regulator
MRNSGKQQTGKRKRVPRVNMEGIKNAKILVVDDITENVKIMAHMLKGMGFAITFARSGYEALETIKSNPPNLVLLDISMPGMDGYEVCERIKKDTETEDIPVIFVTARDNPEDIVRGFEKGAVDYLTRPVNSAELKARVMTHLELKSSRDIIRQQNRELWELNASKDKFLSILAHDLKNPIAGLMTISELATKMYSSLTDSERLNYIKEIHSSAERVLNILEDLLQWSRSQSGRIEYNPGEANLLKITDEALSAIEDAAAKKNISIENNIPPDASVFADRYMIATVIRNLLSNAVKFSYPGGKISLDARENESHVAYQVSDSGTGIPEGHMKRLFRIDGGLSTPGTAKEKGTGLGLILCKEFVEKNKGTIRAESTPDEGSAFIFTLPKPV